MTALLVVLIAVAVPWALAYFQAPLGLWTLMIAVALLSIAGLTDGGGFWLALGWIGWGALALTNGNAIRQQAISSRLLALYRKLLPKVSATEREALEAGTVWWEAEMFSGRPDWRKLLEFPRPTLSEEEQAFLDGPVEALCRMVDDWQVSHELRDLPPEVWQFIKDNRFWGLIIPKEYGGLGFSALAHSAVIEKISSRCGTAAVTVMVPNSLGPAELLLKYGTEAQKAQYLEKLATGQEIPCFALTSPYAGSDAAAMVDYGIVCREMYQGEETLGIRLNWEKRYITLGPVATVLGLAFKLYDPDGLLGGERDIGITLALIPTTHPGVEIGRRHYPARQAFQNGPNSGKDVFIPLEWVIGGRERVGHGWRMLMNCLSEGRSISLPATSTAAVKLAARVTGAYARVRTQFNLPIAKLEGIEEPLARIGGSAYLLEAARRLTAGAVDVGQKPAVISALLKYQATERMRACVNDALDVHGGRAVIDGPSNYLWNPYESVPVAITVEGANILTRTMIVFGQGAIRCHPWLLKEMEAASEQDDALALPAFDEALCGHVGYTLRNLARAAFQNLTLGSLNKSPVDGPAARWFKQLERAAVSFALVADASLLSLGGAFKRKEKLSGRFADALSELYLLSCVLKRFEDDGRPIADIPVLDYTMAEGLYRLQMSLDGILQNLPSRPLAWVLRRAVFPLGMLQRPADDAVGGAVAELLTIPGDARDRLTQGVFVNFERTDKVGCLEHAFQLTIACEALDARIRAAVKDGRLADLPYEDVVDDALVKEIISQEEAEQIRSARGAVRNAIDVDDFAPEVLSRPSGSVWPKADVA